MIGLVTLASMLTSQLIFSQSVGIGTNSPDTSALLEVNSTEKGVLVPRMTTAQRGMISNPVVGLLVFDTDTESFWFKETAGWVNLVAHETDPQVGSLSPGQVPTWDGSALNPGLISDNGSNVSISGNLFLLNSNQGAKIEGYDPNHSIYFRKGWNGANDRLELHEFGSIGLYTGLGNIQDQVERLHITQNGNVGIGTSSPSELLDIAGKTKTTTFQMTSGGASGTVLTGDGSGNASWTPSTSLTITETDPQVNSLDTNRIPKWNGAALVDGIMMDNGTRVGIGTTNPVTVLHAYTDQNGPTAMFESASTAGSGITAKSGAGGTSVLRLEDGINGANIEHWNNTLKFEVPNNSTRININGNTGNVGVFGNLGVGTFSPTTKLDVIGTLKVTDGTQGLNKVLTSDANGLASWQDAAIVETDPQVSSNTTNQVAKWNGTSLEDGILTDNGTNVGIGTTTPNIRLDIIGSSLGSGFDGIKIKTSHPTGGSIVLFKTDNAAVNGQIGVNGSNTGFLPNALFITQAGNHPIKFATNLTDRMIITGAGNVGIGTLSPASPLHIATSENGTTGRFESTTDGWSGINVKTGTGGTSYLLMDDGTNSATVEHWNNNLNFEIPDNTSRMTISGITGNVGIGTTNPLSKLEVTQSSNGNVGVFNGGAGKGFTIQTNPGSVDLVSYGGSSSEGYSNLNIRTGGGSGLHINTSDNVGIGTTSPSTKLDVRTDNNGLTIQSASSSSGDTPLLVRSNNGSTECMIVRANGRVGLGLTAPGGQFELSLDEGRKPSTSTWTIASDERLKNVDGNYTKGLNEILQLEPIRYHYKNAGSRTFSNDVLANENVGLSAQAVQQIFPEAVGEDPDGTMNLNMHAIIIAQINAIKDLDAMNKTKRQEIEHLTNAVDTLSSSINELKAQMQAFNVESENMQVTDVPRQTNK